MQFGMQKTIPPGYDPAEHLARWQLSNCTTCCNCTHLGGFNFDSYSLLFGVVDLDVNHPNQDTEMCFLTS